jgi:L-amino acid N-acyltransferase YncA
VIEDLLISEAKSNDSKFIWELRNEYSIREMMRDTTLIDWETHQEWFLNMLLNDNSHLYIGFFKNQPVAMVRFDLSKNFKQAFEISIAVKTQFQGIGIAKKVLQESIRILAYKVTKGFEIISIVKKKNRKSIRFFESYGFILFDQSKELFYYSLKI